MGRSCLGTPESGETVSKAGENRVLTQLEKKERGGLLVPKDAFRKTWPISDFCVKPRR